MELEIPKGTRYTIQCERKTLSGRTVKPYHVDDKGFVGNQDYWEGEPFRVLAFNGEPVAGRDDRTVTWKEFIEVPIKGVGLYPVFTHKDGKWATYQEKVESVTIHEDDQTIN